MTRTSYWFVLLLLGAAAGILSGARDTWPGSPQGDPGALSLPAKISWPSL